MPEVTTTAVCFPSTTSRDALTAILRSGAQRLEILQEVVDKEF
jgi:hypothetical protein